MKKILLVCILLLFTVSITYAQKQPENAPSPDKILPPNKGIKYCCVKGNYSDLKPGQCPVDNTRLIPEGSYYCEVCDSTDTKSSKCKHCTHDMVKINCPVTVIKEKQAQ